VALSACAHHVRAPDLPPLSLSSVLRLGGAPDGSGFARLANVTSTPLIANYTLSGIAGSASSGQSIGGIDVGRGYVWAGEESFGDVDVIQYGAPSSATVPMVLRRIGAPAQSHAKSRKATGRAPAS